MRLKTKLCCLLMAVLVGAVSNAYAEAAASPAELREMALLSLFIDKHEWLKGLGLGGERSPYGLSGRDVAAVDDIVALARRDLDALQSEAPKYAKENRGNEYFGLRRSTLLSAKGRLAAALTSGGWSKLTSYLEETLGRGLRGTPIPEATPKAGAAKTAGIQTGTVLWSSVDVAFYSGGLGGRSDSWPEGPDAVQYCSSVDGVQGRLNGAVFDGPRYSNNCNGGRAWAGWTRSNPVRGTYKHEGKHGFSHFITGQVSPPCWDWNDLYWPPPYVSFTDRSNCYQSLETPVELTLNAAATLERNKAGHHVVAKNCPAPVTVTASVTPALYSELPPITWSGGNAVDTFHRSVPCTSPGLTSVSASIGANVSATVHVHTIDGNPPPPTSQATLTYQNVGSFASPQGTFGEAAIQIGNQGVTAPTHSVTAGFAGDQWVFHLDSVTHGYKIGMNSNNHQDLPQGYARPFPISPLLPYGTSIAQAHNEARADLNTAGLVPYGSTVAGPRRWYYWVESITWAHEDKHIENFYLPQYGFWDSAMRDFESTDVESASVVYDCNDPTTVNASAVIAKMTPTWDAAIVNRHNSAFQRFFPNAESFAHSASNPSYVGIYNAIPTGGAPAIGGITPSSASLGTSGYIEIYGQELGYNPVVSISGSGVTLSLVYVSNTQINVSYSIASWAPVGPRSITIETDNGTSNAATFTVVSALPPTPPHIGGIIPSAGTRGTSGYIEIYGTDLNYGWSYPAIDGYGVSTTVTYVSSNQVNVYYTVAADATPGAHTLTVTTNAGTSNGVVFTVN